jgi:hypothetical protein
MEKDKQYDNREWRQLVQRYETYGKRNFKIKRLEIVISTVLHRNYTEGFVELIQDYEHKFTKLVLFGKNTCNNAEIKRKLFF